MESMVEGRFVVALIASLLAMGFTTAGIAVIRGFEAWGRRNTPYFACFAAGVLISVSFLHIIPKSIAMSSTAPWWLLVGYFTLHLLNRFLSAHVCDRPTTSDQAIGLAAMLGIALHSFVDGVVYSIAFTVDLFTGVATTIGMVLHEFPEGIVTYLLLLKGGYSERRALLLAFLAAAASTPAGMLASYPFVSVIDERTLGALLAASAGALVYVGATHLLPHAEREPGRFSLIALGAGVLTAVGIAVFGG